MAKKTITAKFRQTEKEMTLEIPQVDGYVDIKLPVKHFFNNGDFITVFQKALDAISKAKLTKNEYKLLLYFIGNCRMNNSICVDLNILSEELQLDKGNLSRALGSLTKRNIIIRANGNRYSNHPLPISVQINYDQLNYNLAYNGKTKNFSKHKTDHPLLTEEDGCTLLESHSMGEPYRILQEDGKYIDVASDGEILMFPEDKE